LSIPPAKILAVDDEPQYRYLIQLNLEASGYSVSVAEDGIVGLNKVVDENPDLVLLDVLMPGVDGFELCRQIRRFSAVPIILLTARAEEPDKVSGLDSGADDYVTKPFSPRELVARINAVLRRSGAQGGAETLDFEGLVLDVAGHRVRVGDRTVALGPTEYRMLEFFMTHPERVYSREQLLDRIWGGNVYVEERTIDVHIRRLRKALEEFGYDRLVQTVRGAGYRFSTRLE
jgi:two-component system phosphate regulon response regulator PhoB